MMLRMSAASRRHQRGYTLIEIAIVLGAIGLIIGGVSIGKEVLREAEYNRINTKFIQSWKLAYDLYRQRTGSVLGDSQIAPTFMVNGFEAVPRSNGGSMAGVPQNYSNTGLRICQGQGYANNSVGYGDPDLSRQRLLDLFNRSGVRVPVGRTDGQEDRYVYQDVNGNPAELQICFQWNPDRQLSGAGNVMVIRGLTPDLARKLDQAIDGKADALEGSFRVQNRDANQSLMGAQQAARDWLTTSSFASNGTDAISSLGRSRADSAEDARTTLLTAHWQMDR